MTGAAPKRARKAVPGLALVKGSALPEEQAEAILTGLAEGRTLRALCRQLGVSTARVQRWRQADGVFAQAFARAREAGFETIAEEALEIADDCEGDWVVKDKADGTQSAARNAENVQRARLRVETRLKLLAKWHPGRYGETARSDGGDGDLAATLSAARARVLKAVPTRAPEAADGNS